MYFIGKYRDRAESKEPELMQKVQHDLSFDAADLLTTEYNERLGHTVKDGELLRRDWASPYFMFDDEPSESYERDRKLAMDQDSDKDYRLGHNR